MVAMEQSICDFGRKAVDFSLEGIDGKTYSLADIRADEWDACTCLEDGRPIDPFTTHRFLSALEVSGSVSAGTGWQPHHITAYLDNQLIAAAPAYAKSHSQGEYVFDHSWADAYMRAGGRYYPKLQLTVPFTPATGRRFLTRAGFEATGQSALVQGAIHGGHVRPLARAALTSQGGRERACSTIRSPIRSTASAPFTVR